MNRPKLHVHSAPAEQATTVRPLGDRPLLPTTTPRVQSDDRTWRALRRAADVTVSGDGRGTFGDIAARHDAQAVQALVTAALKAAKGTQLTAYDLPEHCSQALVADLRRAFLVELGRAADALRPVDMIEALRAIEAVEEAVVRHRPSNGTRLSEADGRSLVVEVAHDMRSPLAAILFLVENISRERSGPLLPAQHRQLGLVYSAAFAMSTLTNDLIEFERGGGSLLVGPPVPFSIAGMMCAVRDIILPIAEEKGLTVSLTPPEADWRVGHSAALHRVLLNLSTNALKFTDEGRVDVSARQLSRTAIEFSVADTGRGLPDSIMESIRDSESTAAELGSKSFCSTGLGLSICRKLVVGMGGELHAETGPGSGSRIFFRIDLPLAPRV